MNLITIIFILIAIYLIFLAFSKVTKLVLRVLIIILVIGFLFLGYNNINDFFGKGASEVKETINPVNNLTTHEPGSVNETINVTNDTRDTG